MTGGWAIGLMQGQGYEYKQLCIIWSECTKYNKALGQYSACSETTELSPVTNRTILDWSYMWGGLITEAVLYLRFLNIVKQVFVLVGSGLNSEAVLILRWS